METTDVSVTHCVSGSKRSIHTDEGNINNVIRNRVTDFHDDSLLMLNNQAAMTLIPHVSTVAVGLTILLSMLRLFTEKSISGLVPFRIRLSVWEDY